MSVTFHGSVIFVTVTVTGSLHFVFNASVSVSLALDVVVCAALTVPSVGFQLGLDGE